MEKLLLTQNLNAKTDNDTDSKLAASDIVTNSMLPLTEALVQAAAILKAKRSARRVSCKHYPRFATPKIQPDDLKLRKLP